MKVKPGHFPLTIAPGTDWSLELELTDSAGAALPLTDYAPFTAQIRPAPGSDTLTAEIEVDNDQVADGILGFAGDGADTAGKTAKEAWDVIDKDGHPWVRGPVIFDPTVTQLA